MNTLLTVYDVTSMSVKSELVPMPSRGISFYVTRFRFLDANGADCCITAMHADEPITLDGADHMNFVASKEAEEV